MFKKIIIKYKEFLLLSIGALLIILSMSLLFYDQFMYIKNEVFSGILLKIHNEQFGDSSNSSDNSDDVNQNVEINTEYIDEEQSEENDTVKDDVLSKPTRDFIGFLEIKKIDLKTGLVAKDSYYNNVNRNVEILKVSDYPDVMNGNLILASHSGTSSISYFKNLYKLNLSDIASVYYKDYVYHYKIVDIYKVLKTGSLEIKRNKDKNVLTLITCTKNSSTEQTVYILELYSKTRNEG